MISGTKAHFCLRGLLLAGAATVMSTGTAVAQDSSSMLEEVVVTAQKREQSLQDVPVAVTALTGEALEANRIRSVTDLSSIAPGLTTRPIVGAQGGVSLTMRGISSTGAVPGSDKEISIYLDGVPLGSTRGNLFDLPDIERIEVLRGPQGTLFGRNATGGAISVITRDPRGEFGVRQDLTVGNYNHFRSRTTVDLPTFGAFTGFVTYVHDERNGYMRNLGAGTVWDRSGQDTGRGIQASPRRLGDMDKNSWFAALQFEPNDRFRATYKFDWLVNNFTPEGYGAAINPDSPLIGPLLAALVNSQPAVGPWGPVSLPSLLSRPDAVNNGFTVRSRQKNVGHSLTLAYDLSDNLSFRSISAYRKHSVYAPTVLGGLDGLVFTQQALIPFATFAAFSTLPPAAAPGAIPSIAAALAPQIGSHFASFTGNNEGAGEQWSTEAQLNYNSDFVTLTAGALWFHSDERAGGVPNMAANWILTTLPANGVLPLGGQAISYNKSTSIAAYGQAEVHVTPSLDLVLGARLTRDKKSGEYVFGGQFVPAQPGSRFGTTVGLNTIAFEYKDTKPNYSVGANYRPTEDILLYAKYSTAFMSGGSASGVAFAPETVKAWELGLKADLLDRRLRMNLALWDADYRHLQSAVSGVSVGRPELAVLIADNGGLKAQGFELEATASIVSGFTIGGTLSYTDAKYTNPNPALVAGAGGGFEITSMPDWTSSLYAQYQSDPLFGDARISARLDGAWRSKVRFESNPNIEIIAPAFAAFEFEPAYWIINARVAIKDIDINGGRAEIALWGRNLTDNDSRLFPLPLGTFLRSSTYEPPRTFGVDLSLTF